jgi:hypothetical protein
MGRQIESSEAMEISRYVKEDSLLYGALYESGSVMSGDLGMCGHNTWHEPLRWG